MDKGILITQEDRDKQDKVEASLEFLHKCLMPSSAKDAKKIDNYFLIEDKVNSVKTKEAETVIDYLSKFKDSEVFDSEYLSALRILRDALLMDY